MCDIRIASDTATFAESFVRVGLVAGDGGAWLLPRAVGLSCACEMAFTGDAITAQQALEYGLVSKVVPLQELMTKAHVLAERIAKNPGQALRLTKRLLREGQHTRLDTLLEMSALYCLRTRAASVQRPLMSLRSRMRLVITRLVLG